MGLPDVNPVEVDPVAVGVVNVLQADRLLSEGPSGMRPEDQHCDPEWLGEIDGSSIRRLGGDLGDIRTLGGSTVPASRAALTQGQAGGGKQAQAQQEQAEAIRSLHASFNPFPPARLHELFSRWEGWPGLPG